MQNRGSRRGATFPAASEFLLLPIDKYAGAINLLRQAHGPREKGTLLVNGLGGTYGEG